MPPARCLLAALLVLLAALPLAAQDSGTLPPARRLVASLRPGESVHISDSEVGCFHERSVVVDVHGGSPPDATRGQRRPRGVAFSVRDAERLDLWLGWARSRHRGGSTTANQVVLVWRRGRSVVLRESFRYSSFHGPPPGMLSPWQLASRRPEPRR
jgi:hypothetical protein